MLANIRGKVDQHNSQAEQSWLSRASRKVVSGAMFATKTALAPFDWWNRNVVIPIAAKGKMMLTPGTDEMEQDYNLYKDAGYNSLQASKKAWENWKAPWWEKALAEIIADPLNVVGFGLLGKIPLAGKALGVAEGWYIAAANSPFRLGGKLYHTGSEAVRQVAHFIPFEQTMAANREMRRNLPQYQRALEVLSGNKPIRELGGTERAMLAVQKGRTPEAQILGDAIWKIVFPVEQTASIAAHVGSQYLSEVARAGLKGRSVAGIGQELRRAANLVNFREYMVRYKYLEQVAELAPVHDQLETMVKALARGQADDPTYLAAARDALDLLRADKTPVALGDMERALRNSTKAFDVALDRLGTYSGQDVVDKLGAAAVNQVKDLAAMEVAHYRAKAGGTAGVVSKIVKFSEAGIYPVWNRYIERHLIAPFAEASLGVPSYTLMNLPEEAIKAVFVAGRRGLGFMDPTKYEKMTAGMLRPLGYGGEITVGQTVKRGAFSFLMNRGPTLGADWMPDSLKALTTRLGFGAMEVTTAGKQFRLAFLPFSRAFIAQSQNNASAMMGKAHIAVFQTKLYERLRSLEGTEILTLLKSEPKVLRSLPNHIQDELRTSILVNAAEGKSGIKEVANLVSRATFDETQWAGVRVSYAGRVSPETMDVVEALLRSPEGQAYRAGSVAFVGNTPTKVGQEVSFLHKLPQIEGGTMDTTVSGTLAEIGKGKIRLSGQESREYKFLLRKFNILNDIGKKIDAGVALTREEISIASLPEGVTSDWLFRSMLSTGTKKPLRGGETWRSRAEKFIESQKTETGVEYPLAEIKHFNSRASDADTKFVGDLQRRARAAAAIDIASQPDFALANLREAKNVWLSPGTMNAISPTNIHHYATRLLWTHDGLVDMAHQITQRAKRAANSLPPGQKQAVFDEAEAAVTRLYVEGNGLVQGMWTGLIEQGKSLGINLDEAGEAWGHINRVYEVGNADLNAWRKQFFSGVEQPNGIKFKRGDMTAWDYYFSYTGQAWDEMHAAAVGLKANYKHAMDKVAEQVGNTPKPMLPPLSTTAAWSPQDVATILGTDAPTLGQVIAQESSLWSENSFVTYFMQTLQNQQAKPEVLAVAEQRLREVHRAFREDLIFKRMDDPSMAVDALVKQATELPFHRAVSDSDITQIQDWLSKLSESVGKPHNKATVSSLKAAVDGANTEAVGIINQAYLNFSEPEFADMFFKSFIPFWMYEEVPTDMARILTKKGWKNCDEVQEGELVLTLDTNTGISHWEPLLHKNIHWENDKEMTSFQRRGVSVISSDRHRWPVVSTYLEKNGKPILHFKTTPELKERADRIQVAAEHGSWPKASILSPRDAAILGWVVTDGYFSGNSTYIYQSSKKYLDEIVSLAGTVPTRHGTDTDFKVCVPINDTKEIRRVYQGDLRVIVPQLSKEAAEAMWDAMWKAEGCNTDGRFVQNQGHVSDAFQMLSILLGKAISIDPAKDSLERTHILQGTSKEVRGLKRTRYTGRMWCPTTPSQTWIMNYGGRVMFTGNSRVVPWMVREGLKHPGLTSAFNRYEKSTDRGYLGIPGLPNVQIGAFRGTALNRAFQLTRRDYPEFVQGPLFAAADIAGRFGIYSPTLEAAGTAIAQLFGGGKIGGEAPSLELGGATPPMVQTTMDLLSIVSPGGTMESVRNLVFHNRFRDYQEDMAFRTLVAEQGLELTMEQALNKLESPRATPEQKAQLTALIETARRKMALFSAATSPIAMFRYRPKVYQEYLDRLTEAQTQLTGVTKEEQEALALQGLRVQDIAAADIPPSARRALRVLQGNYFAGVTVNLLPTEFRRVMMKQDEFYELTADARREQLPAQAADDLALAEGRIGGDEWRDRYSERVSRYANSYNSWLQEYEVNQGVPLSPDAILAWRQRTGQPAPQTDMVTQLLENYYSIKPADTAGKSELESDAAWEDFFQKRDEIEVVVAELPTTLRQEFYYEMTKSKTPMELLFWRVSRTVLRPYLNLSRATLAQFTEEQQEEIQAARSPFSLAARGYTARAFTARVRNQRETMRASSPELDYWLFYFGYTTTLRSGRRLWQLWGLNPPSLPQPETWPDSYESVQNKLAQEAVQRWGVVQPVQEQ